MITPTFTSFRAIASVRDSSSTVIGRNELCTRGRLIVIFAIPSAATAYRTSCSPKDAVRSSQTTWASETAAKLSLSTRGGGGGRPDIAA
jgi:hypothetical protein